jgi:hypothetical protein
MRMLALAVVVAVAANHSANPAAAQFPNAVLNPYGNGWANGGGNWNGPYSQYPTIGFTPNGTRVINPWTTPNANWSTTWGGNWGANWNSNWNTSWSANSNWSSSPYQWNYNYNAYQQSAVWNPSLNPFMSVNNPWATPQALLNQAAVYQRPVQLENGQVVAVAPGVGINPVTGTVVNSNRGIAMTNEGPFYRVPNTGSITPWGRYIPGTGVYVNPFTGSAYNPASGLIVR